MQSRAEAVGIDHATIHLQAVLQPHRALGVAVREDLFHLRIGDEVIHDGLMVLAAHQDIQVTDGLAATTEAAGELELFDTVQLPHVRGDVLADGRARVEPESAHA